MTGGFFKYDRNKFKKLLFLHLSLTVLFSLSVVARCYCTYLGGYHAAMDNSYSEIVFGLFVLSFFIIAIAGLAYIIVPAFWGVEYYFLSFAFIVISIVVLSFVFSFLPDRPLQRGFYQYAQNNIELMPIQEWLATRTTINYDSTDPSVYQFETVARQDWPDSILALNPDTVKLFDIHSQKYVRLVYQFNWGMFGVCVTEEGVDVPLDDYYESWPRLPLQESAFIWRQ